MVEVEEEGKRKIVFRGRKREFDFVLIKYARSANKESVNRNWNKLLDNESGRK